ncbi:MAG: ABC transporter ATP-binding protein, partial [Vulcanimicrobiaceae bacterium]
AVVGESGSGKTTLARVLIGLHRPDRGTVTFDGQPLAGKPAAARPLALRRDVQIIFQNPGNSLNPQSTVADILRHRIRTFEGISGEAARKRMAELLDWVRLRRDALGSRPGGLSGGEQQRVAIARALVGSPRLLICDEILSSLDVLMQARILELLREIQGSRRFSLLFISHDMSLVGAIARRIAVFRRGVACEFGYAGDVINRPQHDYTRELVHAAYLLDKTPQTTTDAQGEVRIR